MDRRHSRSRQNTRPYNEERMPAIKTSSRHKDSLHTSPRPRRLALKCKPATSNGHQTAATLRKRPQQPLSAGLQPPQAPVRHTYFPKVSQTNQLPTTATAPAYRRQKERAPLPTWQPIGDTKFPTPIRPCANPPLYHPALSGHPSQAPQAHTARLTSLNSFCENMSIAVAMGIRYNSALPSQF